MQVRRWGVLHVTMVIVMAYFTLKVREFACFYCLPLMWRHSPATTEFNDDSLSELSSDIFLVSQLDVTINYHHRLAEF